MKIERSDCEVVRRKGWNRIHHRPTNRCVVCQSDDISDEELFHQLQADIDRLESLGLLEDHKDFMFVDVKDEETLH